MGKYKPEYKHPSIDARLREINPTGKDRVKAIMEDDCATCNEPDVNFRNELSIKEYKISGMCQKCQDSIFGAD